MVGMKCACRNVILKEYDFFDNVRMKECFIDNVRMKEYILLITLG